MTGQDFQDRLDSIIEDLQTDGKGQRVQIMLRGADNKQNIFELSSDSKGLVNVAELAAIQNFLDVLKPFADDFTMYFAPVQTASELFRQAREPHQNLFDAASLARTALNAALEADAAYQQAKTVYDAAREEPLYVQAREAYRARNISENFGNLAEAKGKYVA